MIIGMDGGGTKNEYCICDDSGRVLKRAVYKGTNAAELGARLVFENMKDQLADFTGGFGGPEAVFDSFFAGISGGGSKAIKDELNGYLKAFLKNTRIVENGTDTLNAFYAEAGSREGISVISGTGSVAFGVRADATYQVGGWGPLVDDAGSGFVIARTALMHAFRYADGRGPATLLKELFERALGVRLTDSIPVLYKDGRSGIAALSRIVFEARDMGDTIACGVINDAIGALAEQVRASERHFPDPGRILCVASGGTFNDEPFFAGFASMLGTDRFETVRASRRPVIGAVIKAAANCEAVDVDFENNLKMTEA